MSGASIPKVGEVKSNHPPQQKNAKTRVYFTPSKFLSFSGFFYAQNLLAKGYDTQTPLKKLTCSIP